MHQNHLQLLDQCVTIPPELSDLETYRATLGHKANHDDLRHNAVYSVFASHPVLGVIMAVYAIRDIEADEEILCDYGYQPDV